MLHIILAGQTFEIAGNDGDILRQRGLAEPVEEQPDAPPWDSCARMTGNRPQNGSEPAQTGRQNRIRRTLTPDRAPNAPTTRVDRGAQLP